MNYSKDKIFFVIASAMIVTVHNKLVSLPTSFEDHCHYYRKNFCNTAYRQEITQLPEHLLTACIKSNINPKDIHVYKENSYKSYAAHTYGNNISLTNTFEKLSLEQQAWYFAHELSHVKHKDTGPDIQRCRHLVDLKIVSLAISAAWLAGKLAAMRYGKTCSIRPVLFLGMVNVAASLVHYKKLQKTELRANEEASKATSFNAGISVLKEYIWLRDHSTDPSIKSRIKPYLTWLGFSNHPSLEKELAHLETLKQTHENENQEK